MPTKHGSHTGDRRYQKALSESEHCRRSLVRTSLQDALYSAYLAIFRQKDLPETESAMARGVECSDGWYAILDGLCDILSSHARQTGHPLPVATQVKEKFGALCFYSESHCEWCRGAIQFASAISQRVCEETGRPGVLMIRNRRRIRTLAEDVGIANGYCCSTTEAEEPVEDDLQSCGRDLPSGWLQIADALKFVVAQHFPGATMHFGYADDEFVVESSNSSEWLSGAVACAHAIAARTDKVTGAMQIP